MKEFTMGVETKMAQLLTYMEKWGKVTVSAGEAVSVMGCGRNQLASVCFTMLRHKYLVQQKIGYALYYRLQNGLTITRPSLGYLTVSRPEDVDLVPIEPLAPPVLQTAAPLAIACVADKVQAGDEPDELDEADGYLRGRHTWVKAADMPLPFTTAARSVFDLAGRLDHA